MSIPRWLPFVGAALGLGYLVVSAKKAFAKMGDVVAVAPGTLSAKAGLPLPANTFPPGYNVALQIVSATGDQLNGSVVGYIDGPTGALVRNPAPSGFGNLAIDRGDILAVYRQSTPEGAWAKV